ncbi:hypothetical protein [Streptomyces sp. NPDC088766]|uniref:hypothetical protein n=1 Tax=Streptomyces sp. NPDC088766 TaxID=3365893 RepID=UPI0038099AF9
MRRRTLPAGLTAGLAATATPALAAGTGAGGRRVLHVRPGDSVQAAVDAVHTRRTCLGDRRPYARP